MEEPTESPDTLTDPEEEAVLEIADENSETPELADSETEVAAETDVEEVASADEDQSKLDLVDDEFSLHRVLESILFASQKPVSLKELQTFLKGAANSQPENPRVTAFAKLKEPAIRAAFEILQAGYSKSSRTFELRETATGWQLMTKPHYAPWLRQLFPENRPARLSAPAVETLAIIAYRQPITRSDIEAVRGVAVDGVMQSLLDRELVKIAGRAEVPGRPLLYETTQHFMEHFGLKSLEELPNGAELRRAKLPVAESEPVVENGAALETAASAEAAPGEATSDNGEAVETIDSEEIDGEETVGEETSESMEVAAEAEYLSSEPVEEAGEDVERGNRDE